ncbi:hypothetical protein K435DRAFT_871037 [Dendrothele bispora CBS 962.96]|uniref:DUF6534 domain-containing protein n=1 Tax=Dendrothele bispora (strain CBS 962.96) TaxID=1314807 RepID=A0A4S8L550_DENBC|nr:hypothetical protein K435DRAFT_871037 [Dendrothele bispora CBS 962.96]
MAALTTTYGCMFIAMFFVLILYGIVLILGAQYFRTYPSDGLYTKLTVAALLFFGSLHAVCVFVWAYESIINRFGMFLMLDVIPPLFWHLFRKGKWRTRPWDSKSEMDGPFDYSFFATRIWILSKKNVFLAGPVVRPLHLFVFFASGLTLSNKRQIVLALLQLGTASVQSTRVGILDRFSKLGETNNLVILEQCATVACDLIITILLCVLLHTSRSGMKATDDMITRLMIYAINRGVVTSVLAITSLILFLYSPDTLIFLLALLPTGQRMCYFNKPVPQSANEELSSVYIINVLATLHSRKSLRDNYKAPVAHTLQTKGNNGSYGIGLIAKKNTFTPSGTQNSSEVITAPDKPVQRDLENGVHVATSVVTWDEGKNGATLTPSRP